MREVVVAVISGVLFGRLGVAQGTQPTVSPCDLTSSTKYAGNLVRISGLMVFTMHGVVIKAEGCKKPGQGIAVLLPREGGSPPVTFDLQPGALDALKPFFRPTGGAASACVTVTGQPFYKKHFRMRVEGAGPVGNGFGPRHALRTALVVRSVDSIRACPPSAHGPEPREK